MSTTVTRNWNLLLKNENNVTRVYYSGYDKNDLFINSYVDLSQSIIYGGYTDTYMLEQFILPALNSVITDINLTIPNTNNYLTGNSNNESYYIGSLQNNSRLTACKLMCITLTQTVTHTDVESVDYTNILTDINTNLTNLNTNIQNKDNQSDIVQVIKDCFIENINNKDVSVFKTGSSNNTIKAYGIIPTLLVRIASHLSSNPSYTWDSTINNNNKILDNISNKLSSTVPNDNEAYTSSIRMLLYNIFQTLISSPSNVAPDIRSNSLIKQISDKLANANDLHTISQAIDLISTAIAQTPTTDTTNIEQGLSDIKTSIENKDNVLIVDGEQTFKFRDKDS